MKSWEIVLWKDNGTADFKTKNLYAMTEKVARAKAIREFCRHGWKLYSVRAKQKTTA